MSCPWCVKKTHGLSYTPIYRTYYQILDRCNNKNNKQYKDRGWRGIKCEWKSVVEFYEDMKDTYFVWATIERIDNSGNYCKNNCKWIPKSEQSKNRRNNHYITYDGITMTLTDWSKKVWLKRTTLRERINVYNRPIEKALLYNTI